MLVWFCQVLVLPYLLSRDWADLKWCPVLLLTFGPVIVTQELRKGMELYPTGRHGNQVGWSCVWKKGPPTITCGEFLQLRREREGVAVTMEGTLTVLTGIMCVLDNCSIIVCLSHSVRLLGCGFCLNSLQEMAVCSFFKTMDPSINTQTDRKKVGVMLSYGCEPFCLRVLIL